MSETDYGVSLTLTQKCNLICKHCSREASPRKPSMSYKDMRKIVYNLPKGMEEMHLNGGEVFTRQNLMYATLLALQDKSPQAISITTNGFWAKNKKRAKGILKMLKRFGVTNVRVASNDQYHFDAGLDPKCIKNLSRLGDKILPIRIDAQLGHHKIFPNGRAVNFSEEYWGKAENYKEQSYANCTDLDSIIIDIDGKVYPCCHIIPGTSLGNAKDYSLEYIIEWAKDDERVLLLGTKRGPQTLAKEVMSEDEIEKLEQYGNCYVCLEMFRRGLVL